jgi:hypothetical protein
LRAKHLMTYDFSWTPTNDDATEQQPKRGETTFRREFEDFIQTPGCEDWADCASSRVFFVDSAIDAFLVIRRQRTGNCFMHACAILQHYLQCMRTQQDNHEMIDLSEYIRKHLDNEKLGIFLKGSRGDSSVDFFARITGIPRKKMNVVQTESKSSDQVNFYHLTALILNRCTNQGPGLVSCFKVERDFVCTDETSFDYEVEEVKFDEYAKETGGKKPRLHSMVLIGAYKEPSGKVWFTLQNTWRGKYIRKVSDEYMASCKAKISFVPMEHDVSLSEDFELVDAEYAETAVDTPEECVDADLFDEDFDNHFDYEKHAPRSSD